MSAFHASPTPRPRAGVADGRRTLLLAALGCMALALGALVYVTDRPLSGVALSVPGLAALAGRPMFGAVGQWLPSFVHPLAFGLLTAAALPPRSGWRAPACLLWGGVNLAFELGQHARFRGPLSALLQASPLPAWLTRPVGHYLLRGTFDPLDVLAIMAGACAGAAAVGLLDRQEGKHHAR